MTESDAWPNIPMPTLLSDDSPAFSNRDPETSGDAGPIYSQAERDAAKAHVDDPVTEYARRMWHALNDVARYLRYDVARGGSGPVAERAPLLTSDDQWQIWMAECARTLSVLAGPEGDEGYGEQEARLEYQNNFLFRQSRSTDA